MKAAGAILVIDDQEAVRKIVIRTLSAFGYTNVAEADGVNRAVEIARQSRTAIQLLLSDINLGGTIDGVQLAKGITALTPETKVLLMSGNPNLLFDLDPGWQFIPKPFTPSQLLAAVRKTLDAAGMEFRQATSDLTVFTLDLKKKIVLAGAMLEDFRTGPGHEGLLPQNANVVSFRCHGEVLFNLAHEIVGKTRIVNAGGRLQAA